MLLLHGTLLIYAVVSVFAKLAGLRLAAQDAGMTLAFLAAEAAALLAYSLLWQQALRRMPAEFRLQQQGHMHAVDCAVRPCVFRRTNDLWKGGRPCGGAGRSGARGDGP